MQQERKRSRALPPEGWIGESKSVKKRQVINVFSSYLRFIFLIILALTIFMKIKEYQYNFFCIFPPIYKEKYSNEKDATIHYLNLIFQKNKYYSFTKSDQIRN